MKKQIKLRIGQIVNLKATKENPKEYGAEILTRPSNGCVIVSLSYERMEVPINQIETRPEVFPTERWTKPLLKKVLGKVLTIGWSDTDEVETGIACVTYPTDREPSIVTKTGKLIDIDSPSQIQKIRNAKW